METARGLIMKKSTFIIIALSLTLASCSFIDRVFGPPAPKISTSQMAYENTVRENEMVRTDNDELRRAIQQTDEQINAESEAARMRAEAPIPAPAPIAVPTDRLWVTVSFASGRTELTRASRQALKTLAAKFLTHDTGTQRLVVRGYTDNEPIGGFPGHRHASRHNYPTNIALSQARANAVSAVLTGAGIASSKVSTEGLGASGFISDNSTKTERQRNRRAEIHLIQ